MNEMYQGPNDREFDNDKVDALKSLTPRVPRLDWDAIRSAQVAEESDATTIKPSIVSRTSNGPHAVAWWSGMAAGAAIMFFGMQWFVLSDLRAEIARLERLERLASATERAATGIPPANAIESDRGIAVTESSFAVDLLREPTNLSVGSYRRRSDWLVALHARHPRNESSNSVSLVDSTHAQIENNSVLDRDENDPVEPPLNRLRLQKELQREIY